MKRFSPSSGSKRSEANFRTLFQATDPNGR
jgi:hypothetical protein